MNTVKRFNSLILILGFGLCIFLSILVSTPFFDQIQSIILLNGYMNIEYFIRILISAILGFIIGLDRSRKLKPIGLKTYSIISVGASLITIISIVSVSYFSIKGFTQMDPMRLVAQLLPAVGFVGAGTIWFTNNKVQGLTSAAFVFFACTVGIGIGSGFYGITIFTLFIVLIILQFASYIEHKYNLNQNDNDQESEE